MGLLELECPHCDKLLELDAGFAGSVCRCSKCGTLMTVPAEASDVQVTKQPRALRPQTPVVPTSSKQPVSSKRSSACRKTRAWIDIIQWRQAGEPMPDILTVILLVIAVVLVSMILVRMWIWT